MDDLSETLLMPSRNLLCGGVKSSSSSSGCSTAEDETDIMDQFYYENNSLFNSDFTVDNDNPFMEGEVDLGQLDLNYLKGDNPEDLLHIPELMNTCDPSDDFQDDLLLAPTNGLLFRDDSCSSSSCSVADQSSSDGTQNTNSSPSYQTPFFDFFNQNQTNSNCDISNGNKDSSYSIGSPQDSLLDSPPLTPPEVKVDTSTGPLSLAALTAGSGRTLVLSGTQLLAHNLPKLLPALKNSRRGRSASNDDSPDVQALKRHIRMIRNRESASLSRKKKKEYLTGLESEISQLKKENDDLRRENSQLKARLNQFHHQQQLKSNTNSSNSFLSNSTSSKVAKDKTKIVAKMSLFALACFAMISLHPSARAPSPLHHHIENSNLTDFSRTLTNLRVQLPEPDFVSIPSVDESPSSIPWTGDENNKHKYKKYLNFTSVSVPSEEIPDLKANNKHLSNVTSNTNGSGIEMEIGRNRNGSTSEEVRRPIKSQKRRRSHSQLNSAWSTSSMKSASLLFPFPHHYVNSTSNKSTASSSIDKCPNTFNKTESMRVQSDLQGIFSKGKRNKNKMSGTAQPIVYSLISSNSVNNPAENSKGLTLYEGGEKLREFSSILEKLERREDTFYVVSLASENHLLLSAKASNDSSRPKISFLMPWRNDTVGAGKEEMLLQIDCEVFQVFNLNQQKNEKTTKKSNKQRSNKRG